MRYALTALGLIAIALVGTFPGMAFAQEVTTTSDSMTLEVFKPRFIDKWDTRNRVRGKQCVRPNLDRPYARSVSPDRRRAVLARLNYLIDYRRSLDTMCLPDSIRHEAGGPGRWRLPATYGSWLCIHSHEGAWNDPNSPYYGGLQMDMTFQRQYGPRLLRYKGTANHWDEMEQMWVAEHARRSGRGFYPWPNTARYCGLI